MSIHKKVANILVVEDNSADIELFLMQQELANIKMNVSFVRDGEECLEVLSKKSFTKPDIVLVDLNLPKVNGLEVIKQIKSNPQHYETLVVAISSTDNVEEHVLAKRYGASDFLSKPINFQRLYATLEMLYMFEVGTHNGKKTLYVNKTY